MSLSYSIDNFFDDTHFFQKMTNLFIFLLKTITPPYSTYHVIHFELQ